MKNGTLLLLAIVITLFVGCKDDDNDPFNDIDWSYEGTITPQIENRGTFTRTITFTSTVKLASLTVLKDDFQLGDLTYWSKKEATYEFTYTATEEDDNQLIVFDFEVRDKEGWLETLTFFLEVGDSSITSE